MISAGDFKNGLTIELEGNVYQIVDFQHVKPGLRTVVLLRRHSVQQRSSHQHISSVQICSIYIQMVIYITSWM